MVEQKMGLIVYFKIIMGLTFDLRSIHGKEMIFLALNKDVFIDTYLIRSSSTKLDLSSRNSVQTKIFCATIFYENNR